jgi:eukaryotic-like serine/threonine-protein kinase
VKRLSERYSVAERIGRGGVGDVYKGWQEALDRPVAIKVLRAEFTRNAQAMRRFEREARTTSRLRHPNVVTVFDVGLADDGTRFLVMELLEGTSLARLLAEKAPLPIGDALAIARQIIRGMSAGEGVGLVHRDLKPENIFLERDLQVKILDFGLATLLDTRSHPELEEPSIARSEPPDLTDAVDSRNTFSLEGDESTVEERSPAVTQAHAVMGTPRYMPPEQVLGWGIDHRSDLYAFGCILFEMLAGRPPFPGPDAADYMRQHLHAAHASLRELRPDVSDGLLRIVERLLEKAPAARFQDWAALDQALAVESELQEETRGVLLAATPSGEGEPLPTEPYRFLQPFSAASQAIFFGRDKDVERFRSAWDHLDRPRLLFVTGASGVGKTSFLMARIVPTLQHAGNRVLVVRGGTNPFRELEKKLGAVGTLAEALRSEPTAIVLDQTEEIFTSGTTDDHASFRAHIRAIVAESGDRVRLVLGVREDFLGALLRTLQPLPLDELARTVPLQRLEADDIRKALAGPGRPNVAVRYRPFHYEPAVLDVIVRDLLADSAGEVAPRVQAVGSRLWEMVKDDPDPRITEAHYVTRLGGAQGILARTLDEAVNDLEPADRDIAKELLWALTNLPGSATSRPAAESELVARAVDGTRRKAVLQRLEDRWRVVQGFFDPRWPDERSYRIAHESLIQHIQQYGHEGTERTRARQLFHHGLALWLQGGRRDGDVLSEDHFAEIQGSIEDLVLRTEDEQAFYDRCLSLRAAGWTARVADERRRNRVRGVTIAIVPTLLVVVGFVLGQMPVGFRTLRELEPRIGSLLHMSGLDLRERHYTGSRLRGVELLGVRLDGAVLEDVDLTGADLERASFRGAVLDDVVLDGANLKGAVFVGSDLENVRFHGADLRHATLGMDLAGADFLGALFDRQTLFAAQPPKGALGPGGDIAGLALRQLVLPRADLQGLHADGADLSGADLSGSYLERASFEDATLVGASLARAELGAAHLARARLSGADLTDAHAAGADLTRAELRDVSLAGADLAHARLDGADLCGADLRTAHLEQTSFAGARSCASTRWPGDPPPDLASSEP